MKMLLTIVLAVSLVYGTANSAQEVKGSSLKQANSLAGRGDYTKAIEKYKLAEQEEPRNPQVYHMWGRTLALTGNLDGAAGQYRKALKLAPNNAELLNDLGVALTANGYDKEGAEQLKRSVAADPKFTSAFNNLGVTLSKLGEYKGAADAFRQSLKLQPGNPLIQKKLNEALSRQSAGGNPSGQSQ